MFILPVSSDHLSGGTALMRWKVIPDRFHCTTYFILISFNQLVINTSFKIHCFTHYNSESEFVNSNHDPALIQVRTDITRQWESNDLYRDVIGFLYTAVCSAVTTDGCPTVRGGGGGSCIWKEPWSIILALVNNTLSLITYLTL